MNNNYNYNSSSIDRLGKIPRNWKVVKWKYLSNEPMMYGANESAELDDRELPRYIRITDLDSYGNLKDDTFKSLPLDKAKGYMLINGDILLARSGATVGKAYIHKDDLDACFAGYLIRYRPNQSKIIPRLVYYFTQTGLYADWIRENTIQATIQNVSAEKYANLSMPVPPLEEQENIVYFLDEKTSEIDSLIADKEKLIELLEEKHQAIITEAVTKGLNPNAKMKDSGVEWIGEIPEHWEIKKFKRGIEFLTDYEANGSFQDNKENVSLDTGEPYAWYVRATDLENKRYGLVEGNRYCDHDTYEYLSKTKLYGGELLIAKRGEIGKVYLMPKVQSLSTLAPNLYLIRLNNKLDPTFAYYWFISVYGNKELVNANKSTTIGALYKDDVKECLCVFSDTEEQKQIAKFLKQKTDEVNLVIEQVKKQIEKLKEYRQSLIYEAITGKIDVRDYKKVLS